MIIGTQYLSAGNGMRPKTNTVRLRAANALRSVPSDKYRLTQCYVSSLF